MNKIRIAFLIVMLILTVAMIYQVIQIQQSLLVLKQDLDKMNRDLTPIEATFSVVDQKMKIEADSKPVPHEDQSIWFQAKSADYDTKGNLIDIGGDLLMKNFPSCYGINSWFRDMDGRIMITWKCPENFSLLQELSNIRIAGMENIPLRIENLVVEQP